jgi:hypothetical protein
LCGKSPKRKGGKLWVGRRIEWLHQKGVLYKGKSIAAAYKNKRGAVVRTLLRVSKESQN